MKSEFEQEVQSLIKKLNNCSEVFNEMYRQLKRILYFQLLIIFALLSFILISLMVPYDIGHGISGIIIPLVITNYILIILHRNSQKKKMNDVYEEGTIYMGRLSDIIDWTSVRNKYINKDDRKVINAITSFILLVEKPLSPFRHFHNYYRFILYLSLALSFVALVYYVIYCLNLIGFVDLNLFEQLRNG